MTLAGRSIAAACILALAAVLLPLGASAAPASWTRIADGGVTDVGNQVLLPGVIVGGKLTVGAGSLFGGSRARMYYYDTSFHQVGDPGLGSDNTRLMPWALYGGRAYIGTENQTTGGELYRWSGAGDPVKVAEHGWGLGVDYDLVNPIAVFQDKLLVCVGTASGGPATAGLRIMQNDGTGWTQVVGKGAAGTVTGPGFGQAANESITATEFSEIGGRLTFAVSNDTAGVQVFSYDGTTFSRIGAAGAGAWPVTLRTGQVASSALENRLYLGAGNTFGGPAAELWSYDGALWTKVALSGGLEDAGNFYMQPFIRGDVLYVAAWNAAGGCRIYKRVGNSFTPFSEKGFGNPNNVAAMLATYNGVMFGETANPTGEGAEVYATPIRPSITRLVPSAGPAGSTVRIEGHDFGLEQTGDVTLQGADLSVLAYSDTAIEVEVPRVAGSGSIVVETSRGSSNRVAFTATLSKTWHFAEGTTRDNAADGRYEEWICIQNPGAQDAEVTLTYMLVDGTNQEQAVSVRRRSRCTVSVNGFLGPDKDASTLVTSNEPVLAERSMYFNYKGRWTGGHDALGTPEPGRVYYFAEGTTRSNPTDGSFDEWLCIQNPGDMDARVTVEYLLGPTESVTRSYELKKRSRHTISVNSEIGPGRDVSCVVRSDRPVVAERPMYFDYHGRWTGGHNVVGANNLSTTFYFAEGTTRDNQADGSFDEWICLENPNTDIPEVTVTFHTGTGEVDRMLTVPARGRITVDVQAEIGRDVDNSIEVRSSRPILVERPMYFNYHGVWDGGHDVMGCGIPARNCYFAEGTTRGGFATWIAVFNPGGSDAHVSFHYMLGDGTTWNSSATVAPGRRYTRNVQDDVGPDKDVSIHLESDVPVVAERPMYFDYHGWATGGHDTVGYGI